MLADVESDWTLRTDSQLSQASSPSPLPAAAAAATPVAAASTPRAVAPNLPPAPPPTEPLIDELANLSLDPHLVDDEPETQESIQARAPGAYPVSDNEEESTYVDARETQTSP